MKYFVILMTLVGFTGMIMPNVFASENLFYGTSSLERFPSAIIPDNSQIIEIKFHYQDGPYSLSDFKPIIDVNPVETAPYVHVEFDPVNTPVLNSVTRIYGTIIVDSGIPSEKIFLNISYVGTYSIDPPVSFKSGWNDSAIINIAPKDFSSTELPSSQGYEFETMSGARCDGEFSLCYGTFANGTTISIQCDYRHSCGVVSFDDPVYLVPWNVSPLKQFKSGIAIEEIQCKENLVLIQKYDGSPACVKPESIPKLTERGWTKSENSITETSEIWEPGPTDGHTPTEIPLHENQDANELESYRDAKSSIVIPEDAVILPDKELDRTLENLRQSGLPIVMSAIDYDTGVIAIWTPDLTIGDQFKAELGDIPFVLLYEEAPPRWETGDPEPEPEQESESEMQLYNAKKSLQTAYSDHVNLGPYYMRDVIVGFGTYEDTLIIDIPSKYTDSESIQIIKKEIRHIVGEQVNVDFVVYDKPIETHIATVIPYLWNQILHQNKIDFNPKDQGYWNNADGFHDHDRVCSPLIASNGTEFYISSTFDLEPFEITGTYIDQIKPDDCHKIWKTDVIMQEPDRVTALWLENEN